MSTSFIPYNGHFKYGYFHPLKYIILGQIWTNWTLSYWIKVYICDFVLISPLEAHQTINFIGWSPISILSSLIEQNMVNFEWASGYQNLGPNMPMDLYWCELDYFNLNFDIWIVDTLSGAKFLFWHFQNFFDVRLSRERIESMENTCER